MEYGGGRTGFVVQYLSVGTECCQKAFERGVSVVVGFKI
jgi:hypothetical protein